MIKAISVDGKAVRPSKIVCVGRNYVEHIEELKNEVPTQMVVFNKPNSSITHQLLSFHQEPLHYETELCFMIKNNQIAAVGVGLDLTKRELQSQLKAKQLPWERAKAFDGSAIFSQFISLRQGNWQGLNLELLINSVRVQAGGVNEMIFSPDDIVEELLSYTSLNDGDVVMTGTPSGVGVVHAGDNFTVRLKQYEQLLLECNWLAE